MLNRHAYLLLFTFLVFFSLLPGSINVYKDRRPLGSDFEYHLRLSNAWLNGENPLQNEEYFLSGSPYPPAFHLVVAFFSKILFLSPLKFMSLLQIILFPSILISFSFMVYKRTNLYTAVLSACFLSTSIAFHDRAGQVIPQALDVLLFPMAVYFFLEKKNRPFILISVLLIYNHALYAVLLLSSLLLYSVLYEKGRVKEFGAVALLSLPLFMLLFTATSTLAAPLSIVTKTTSSQHAFFTSYPLFGVAYLGYFLSLFSFIGILYFVTKEKTDIDRILLFWVVFLLPLYISLPDRFMSYAAQPLSMISGITMHEALKTEKSRALFLVAGFIAAFLYTLVFISTLQLFKLGLLKRLSNLLFYSYRII
jgi:hypothetical protein